MDPRPPFKDKWKPGVSKSALLFIAGAVWMGVGIGLDILAWSWLKRAPTTPAFLSTAVGIIAALIIHHFGFLRIVDRNLGRIRPMKGRRCAFAFIPLKSYLLIAVMILLGTLLRHSPIPRLYLAPVYIGIGTALILSSIRYLRNALTPPPGPLP